MFHEMSERKNAEGKDCPESPFSERLRRLLWYGSAVSQMEGREGTWLAGLCWIVAQALLQWMTSSRTLPPPTLFLVVVGDARCPAGHVAVCVRLKKDSGQERRLYLDANGVSTEHTFLRYWRDEEGLINPFVASYDEQLLRELGIPWDEHMSTRLAECFFETFGTFSSAFLNNCCDTATLCGL